MAATESWEVGAFHPEFQAAFVQEMSKSASSELGSGGQGAAQARNTGASALEKIQPKPYERMFQCWDLEFQEFLEAEDVPWEDSRLQNGLSPWENTEAFLASFQQVALACRWPRNQWVARLLPALDKDAEEAFRSLEDKDQGDFWKVKAAILQREAMNQERKRQKFRRFCYQEANGPREVCLQLQHLCHQWLKAGQQTKEHILEQLVLEQFLAILPKEMQAWVRDRCPVTCNRAVTLAEDFLRKLLAAERQEGQQLQEPEDVALDYSKTRTSEQDRDLLWSEKEISLESSLSRRSFSNYSEVGRDRKKSLEREHFEQAKHWPRSRGRPSRASPYPLKGEVTTKERRRSERLREIYPEPKPNRSPPRKEAYKKVYKAASLPPETPQSKTKTCPDCGKNYTGVSSFMRHQARHTGEKRYKCCFCSKGYCWKSDLVRHETVHTGKKPHECQFCGEGFDRKWQRERHELVHAKAGRKL